MSGEKKNAWIAMDSLVMFYLLYCNIYNPMNIYLICTLFCISDLLSFLLSSAFKGTIVFPAIT